MSMARFTASQDGIATGTAKKVLLELGAPASGRLSVYEWWIHFDGVTASATPVLVEIIRATASITSGGSVTPVPNHLGNPSSSQATVEHTGSSTYPHSGTAGGTIRKHRIPPTTGYDSPMMLGREIEIAPSEFLWLVVTAGATVNATPGFSWEE